MPRSHAAATPARPSAGTKAKPSRAGSTPATRNDAPVATTQEIADLAWAGQHAKAIELATAALTGKHTTAQQLELLDLRAESHIALGDLRRAGDDADAMVKLARSAKTPGSMAQALNRRALVQMRSREFEAALATATTALRNAKKSKEKRLIAMSLFRLAEAQYRAEPVEKVLEYATEAAAIFKALGDPSGQGRALWVVSMWRGRQGRATEGDQAAAEALALCRSCGDLYGAGNALNMLVFHEPDLATVLKQRSLALADFEAAGYVERQTIITGNQGIVYARLGLYRRARRLYLKASEMYRRMGASAPANSYAALAEIEFEMGHLERARAQAAAMEAIVNDLSGALTRYALADTRVRLHCLRVTRRQRCASSSVRTRSHVTAILRRRRSPP